MRKFDLVQSLEEAVISQADEIVGLLKLTGSFGHDHGGSGRAVAWFVAKGFAGDRFGIFVGIDVAPASTFQQATHLVDQSPQTLLFEVDLRQAFTLGFEVGTSFRELLLTNFVGLAGRVDLGVGRHNATLQFLSLFRSNFAGGANGFQNVLQQSNGVFRLLSRDAIGFFDGRIDRLYHPLRQDFAASFCFAESIAFVHARSTQSVGLARFILQLCGQCCQADIAGIQQLRLGDDFASLLLLTLTAECFSGSDAVVDQSPQVAGRCGQSCQAEVGRVQSLRLL